MQSGVLNVKASVADAKWQYCSQVYNSKVAHTLIPSTELWRLKKGVGHFYFNCSGFTGGALAAFSGPKGSLDQRGEVRVSKIKKWC